MPTIHIGGESEYRPTKHNIGSIEDARRFNGSHKIDPDDADQVAETEETIPNPLRKIFTMWDV